MKEYKELKWKIRGTEKRELVVYCKTEDEFRYLQGYFASEDVYITEVNSYTLVIKDYDGFGLSDQQIKESLIDLKSIYSQVINYSFIGSIKESLNDIFFKIFKR